MHACECFICEGDCAMIDEDKDSTVTLPTADSSVSNVSVNLEDNDDARGIASLFMALSDVFGSEIACDFLFTVSDCPPDEQVKIDIRTEKIDGSTRPYDPMKDLKQWHEATGGTRYDELDQDGQDALLALRRTLINEEEAEIYDEINYLEDGRGSMKKLAKELADMLYVVYGTADLMGINLPAVFQRVHANNMTKVDPETGKVARRSDGKILKPIGFQELTEDEIDAVMG